MSEKIMRVLICSIMLMAAVSCGLEEIGTPGRNDGGGIWTGPGMNAGKDDPDKTVWYVTLMDYPDGYDWRADCEKGAVRCSLVVLANGIPMMRVPVGDEYETASDPDMHRMVGGHLYTDYSTEEETVIKKDGREIFRYPGREVICGMAVDSSSVYTLGQSREGEGFSYRRNGEVILERARGRTFGRLQRDGDDICFAFAEPVISASDTIERYYHVRNGIVSQTALREDVKKVLDIVTYQGEVCYLADMVGIGAPVLVCGDIMESLHMPGSSRMMACRLSMPEGRPMIEGVLAMTGRALLSGYWDSPGQFFTFPGGLAVSSICFSEGSVSCILNPSSLLSQGRIYHNGEFHLLPQGYVSMGGNTIMKTDGILQAGLSSKSCGKPIMWRDGISDTLDYNGYISSVTSNKVEDVMIPRSASWTGQGLW